MKPPYNERELREAVYNARTISDLLRIEPHIKIPRLKIPRLKIRLVQRLKQITMKKLLFLIFVCTLLTACENSQVHPTLISNTGGVYEIVVIDSCEYLFWNNSSFTHKGNCKNPIHKRTKPGD